jgi:DEAD/DEAH box helicase domain-containing protein
VIACTATVANPEQLFERLTSRTPTLITEDGAPRGRKTILFLESRAESQLGANEGEDFGGNRPNSRATPNQLTAYLMARMTRKGARTMAFCRARATTEHVLRAARALLKSEGRDPDSIESYRGGYTPKERRAIEKALFGGRLDGLVTTSAMELGVDVGDLDAIILNGYPGSLASFWQQIGRAGRGGRDAVAIFVAHENPLEQFLARRPEQLFGEATEASTVNPSNPAILAQHLRCAAYERPIAPTELAKFGDLAVAVAEDLDAAGDLHFSAGRFYYPSHTSPATGVSIRGLSGQSVLLELDGAELGQMEYWRALCEAHDGAVYMHRDRTYLVQSLDLVDLVARLSPEKLDYYTQPVIQDAVRPTHEIRSTRDRAGWRLSLCGIEVSMSVGGFRQVSLDGDEVIGTQELELPNVTFETVGIRLDLPARIIERDLEGAISPIHGLEHALLASAPLWAACDPSDLGSAWYVTYLDTLAPCLFLFDRAPGGVGLSQRLFERAESWGASALDLLESCPCLEGCPACLLNPRCSSGNEFLDKAGAIELLRDWLY